jgi:surfactin synthase thioesterase subunit
MAILRPSTTLTTLPWFRIAKSRPAAKLRLFCFPYAGGGALIYHGWQDGLPAAVELCACQLPGRGDRLHEQPFMHITPMVEAVAEAITPYLDNPFAFFGHSMGAMIAFELARRLRREHTRQPAHLFVSGRRAPQIPYTEPFTHDLPEPQFFEKLRLLNGTPGEVLEHPELMQLMIPSLRGDFAVVETYTYVPESPLQFPITAFGGMQDPEVSREDLKAWREQTTSSFMLRMMPGDHFFLNTARPTLLGALSRELYQLTAMAT